MVRKLAPYPAGSGFVLAGLIWLFSPAHITRAADVSYTVRLPKNSVMIERADGSSRVSVDEKGYDRLGDAGQPALPYRVFSVLLPQGHEVQSYNFVASKPLPLERGGQFELATVEVAEDGTIGEGVRTAESGAAYPNQWGRYIGTGYLHGHAIASFAVFPLRVQAGNLLLSEAVTVSVTTRVGDMDGVVVRERFREGFDGKVAAMLGRLVVNPEMAGTYALGRVRVPKKKGGFQPTSFPSLEGSPVDYLIITRDSLVVDYQRLADWKTAKGVPTVIRTLEWIEANTRNGVDLQETVRFFVREAYAKWGITYLLLGGDTDIVPARFALSRFYLGGTEVPVDMYFGALDGSWNDTHDQFWGEGFNVVPFDNPDLFVEVYNGRIPVSDKVTTNLMIDKVMSYETAEVMGYQDRYMFLAEVLFPAAWPNPPVISLNGADFAELLLSTSMVGHTMDMIRMYETEFLYPGAVHESRQNAIDSLNTGLNHVNHIGHGFRFNMSCGDASILNSHADVLTNNGQWFNLYMLNCTAAAYDFFCLGEHFLRSPNGGAVSVVGANQSAFPNASGNYMNEYYRLMFQDDVVHIGETFARSRLPRTPVAQLGDNVDLWTHYIYSLLGEPEMQLYTGVVDTVSVSHATNVALGSSGIVVNVTAGGLPVDSATVCLSKGDDDYQVATTDVLGNASMTFTAESAGSISVVVTGFNLARKQTFVTVDPSVSAFVTFSGVTIDDDALSGTVGNGDGVVDAGETIDLMLTLANTGGAVANGVSFVLRTQNPLVTVLDSTGTVGTIAAGGSGPALDPVRVACSPSLADEAVVEFEVDIVDGGSGVWSDRFKKLVHAPKLELTQLRIDDTVLGNGNGVVENNEQFRLYYGIKNYGTGAANGLGVVLDDISGGFAFVDSADTYSDLTAIASGENLVGFQISEANTAFENPLRIVITDGFGRTVEDTIELRPPDAPTNLGFDSSLGLDRIEVRWLKPTATDVRRYNLYVSPTSGGPFTRANVDPVDHAVFLVTGLAPSTAYFFEASAIDTAGNESALSVEGTASTNPPQTAGFPIGLLAQVPGTPAVGDIDGDGDLEIVVGNQRLYAWHHDGFEIRDGDADPQTWGVLNTLGGPYGRAVTLARMDATPGLEIIAGDMGSEDPSNIGTKSMYVVNFNGDLLPGWPKQGEFGFGAPPVAADIDGDNVFEVLAVDDFGALYVWRLDGSEYRDGDSNPATDGIFFRPTPIGTTYMGPAVCDLDGDGLNEIILGTREGIVYAMNEDGSSVAGWPFVMPSEAVGSPVIGDIDDDGLPEIVVRAKTSQVYVLNHDATTINLGWPRFVAINNPFFAASPALADFDNDGKLEIVLTHDNSADGRVYIINHLGIDLPGWPLSYSTSSFGFTESTPTVADIDGDGSLDIVLGSETRFINAWDISANLIAGFPIQSGDAIRATPFIGDVDGDLDVDLVVNSWDQSIYMYDLASPYNPNLAPWPTQAGNMQRTGKFGFTVATGIGTAAFSFAVEGDGIQLTWRFGVADGSHYDIARSLVGDDGEPGEYVGAASKLTTDDRGDLRFSDRTVEVGERYVFRLSSVEEPGEVFTTQAIYVPISRAELTQNYPNPFNPTTRIVYLVPEGAPRHVSLVIYDVTGARVRALVNGRQSAGRFVEVWDGMNDRNNPVGSGMYFYRLSMPGFTDTKKMLLLK